MGVSINKTHHITNYTDLLGKKQAIVNDLVRQFNLLKDKYNASTDKAYKEKLDKQMKALEEKI